MQGMQGALSLPTTEQNIAVFFSVMSQTFQIGEKEFGGLTVAN